VRSEPLPAGADLTVVEIRDDAGAAAPEPRAAEPRGAEPQILTPAQAPQPSPLASPRPSPRRAGGFFGEIPLALVICGVGVGLLVIAMHHFRWGNLAISISVLAGALFRLILPARKAGLLVVRTRFTDVVTMGIIGGALMVLAAVTST
jgi:hypothetical protein